MEHWTCTGSAPSMHACQIYLPPLRIDGNVVLTVHATFPIDPEQREEALDLLRELAEHSLEEDGIIKYRVETDIDDGNLFRFFEQYKDEVAFGARADTEHFGEVENTLPNLLAGEPDVARFEVDASTDIEL